MPLLFSSPPEYAYWHFLRYINKKELKKYQYGTFEMRICINLFRAESLKNLRGARQKNLRIRVRTHCMKYRDFCTFSIIGNIIFSICEKVEMWTSPIKVHISIFSHIGNMIFPMIENVQKSLYFMQCITP